MRKQNTLLIFAASALLLGPLPCLAQGPTIPEVKAKALDDSEVTLPKAGSTQPLILVVGFSKRGGEVCKTWGQRISTDFGSDPRVAHYQIPVLEDAPSFIRPMILRGMRKDLPATEQQHMVPIYQNEEDWKKLVGFSGPDDAYILLTDAQGHVVWQTHGALTTGSYEQLKTAVAKLLAGPAATQH